MKYSIIFILLIGVCLCQSPFPEGENFKTGFITIDEQSKDKLFYWLFDSRNVPTEDPLVLWLTGGPGCSSELACLVENGPYRLESGASTPRILKEGWNDKANLLFIDQPIGTGFSSGNILDYCTTEDCVAKDFFIFFKGFLERFPEYKKRPFFITGESYAGHYIPAIAAYLKAQSLRDPKLGINLVSLAIGNGLTDPYNQYPAYAEFAYHNTAKQLINKLEYDIIKKDLKECQDLIKKESKLALEKCLFAQNKPGEFFMVKHLYRFNVYDVTKKCEGQLCYDFSNVDTFLNTDAVQKALGVDGEHKKWVSCDNTVHAKMMGDWMNNLAPQIKYLLTNDVHVLIYAGDLDYICNYMGNKEWTLKLDWAYTKEFNAEKEQPWPSTDGEFVLSKNYGTINYKKGQYGLLRKYQNFSFLQVFKAGHMVPMDQPQASIVMLDEFFHEVVAKQNKLKQLKQQKSQ